jgi:hypothetical protein
MISCAIPEICSKTARTSRLAVKAGIKRSRASRRLRLWRHALASF